MTVRRAWGALAIAGALAVIALLLLRWGRPIITRLDDGGNASPWAANRPPGSMPRGPRHALVAVEGQNLAFTRVVWDAGRSTERVVPGGWLGGYMFSVPPDASVGRHSVAVTDRWGRRSNVVQFDVVNPGSYPFGKPRIDAVTLIGSRFDQGNVTTTLYVQGANFDVGAVVLVDDVEVATVAHKGLRNPLHGVRPRALGYPIYHFVSLVAVPGPHPAAPPSSSPGVQPDGPCNGGTTVMITVRNLDGQDSVDEHAEDEGRDGRFPYTLPTSPDCQDSDGDGLPDWWETKGYDADHDGAVDVNLPALGADPYRRDIFVQLDIMKDLQFPPAPSTADRPGAIDTAKKVFAAAPILNPFGNSGINLFVDTNQSVDNVRSVIFDEDDSPESRVAAYPPDTQLFSALKAKYFDTVRRRKIFHYGIWAIGTVTGRSGLSNMNAQWLGRWVWSGDDFVIGLDSFTSSGEDPPPGYQRVRSQAEIFVHELGHDLGQQHGGDDDDYYRPNYWSVMSYTWVLRTGVGRASRRQRVTCEPFYYSTPGATDVEGDLPAITDGYIDYSDGMAKPLYENTHSLSEPVGVCGIPVHWNGNENMTDTHLNADIDLDAPEGPDVGAFEDYANWRDLVFMGPMWESGGNP